MEAAISDFVNKARQYCDLIERSRAVESSWTFAKQSLQSLLGLFAAALALPETESGSQQRVNDRIGHAEWEGIRRAIAERLSRDVYWEVFDPMEVQPSEPVAGSISDDLADIWRDVKVGLEVFNADTNSAVWQWRFSMETHWGRHVAGAAAALTALCFGPHSDETRP